MPEAAPIFTHQSLHEGAVYLRSCGLEPEPVRTPFYSERERAALAWTEAVTRVADTHVPEDVYQQTTARFDNSELLDLTLAITVINSWNRIAISARTEAGSYHPEATR